MSWLRSTVEQRWAGSGGDKHDVESFGCATSGGVQDVRGRGSTLSDRAGGDSGRR